MSVATDIDTTTIEHLDFDPTTPCGHRQHHTNHPGDEPAAWRIITLCPSCRHVGKVLVCEPGRHVARHGTIGCPRCGKAGTWEDFVLDCQPLEP